MNIAITRANGFLGKNLIFNLLTRSKDHIFYITRKTSKEKLNSILKKSDIIFHFAGVNIPSKQKTFDKDNIELTKYICNYLLKHNLKKKIVFSSTIQVKKNNEYGKSKKNCEKILNNFAKKNNSKVIILRLPNIFGKWSKPNYNTVVSTFCSNISRNKKLNLIDPNKKLNLLYIDDLVNLLIKLKNQSNFKSRIIEKFQLTKKISVRDLSKLILCFEKNRKNFYINDLNKKFIRDLYSTYITFLPKKKIQYKLNAHVDSRGSFIEFIKTNSNGQFSVFIAKKNQVRGHHFHHSKVEKFLAIKGKGEFYMNDISSNKKMKFLIDGNYPTVIESIPGWQHYIKNTGFTDLIVLLWSNEVFNVNKPDTYRI